MAFRPRDHERLRKLLLEAGADPAEVEQQVAESRREDAEIAAGRCPKCGAPVTRYGPEETAKIRSNVGLHPAPRMAVPGAWAMYRCSTQKPPGVYNPDRTCDFGVDVYEPDLN